MFYSSVIKIVLETLAAKNSYEPCATFGEMRCLYRSYLPQVTEAHLRFSEVDRSYTNNLKAYSEVIRSLKNSIGVETRYLESHFGENQLTKALIIDLLYPGLKGRSDNLLDLNMNYTNVDLLYKSLDGFKDIVLSDDLKTKAAKKMDVYIPAAFALHKVMQHESTREFFDGFMRRAAHLSCHSKKPMTILRKDAPAWLRGE